MTESGPQSDGREPYKVDISTFVNEVANRLGQDPRFKSLEDLLKANVPEVGTSDPAKLRALGDRVWTELDRLKDAGEMSPAELAKIANDVAQMIPDTRTTIETGEIVIPGNADSQMATAYGIVDLVDPGDKSDVSKAEDGNIYHTIDQVSGTTTRSVKAGLKRFRNRAGATLAALAIGYVIIMGSKTFVQRVNLPHGPLFRVSADPGDMNSNLSPELLSVTAFQWTADVQSAIISNETDLAPIHPGVDQMNSMTILINNGLNNGTDRDQPSPAFLNYLAAMDQILTPQGENPLSALPPGVNQEAYLSQWMREVDSSEPDLSSAFLAAFDFYKEWGNDFRISDLNTVSFTGGSKDMIQMQEDYAQMWKTFVEDYNAFTGYQPPE